LFLFRYESDTRVDINVTNQASTYVEFKLKRKDYSVDNQDFSKIKEFYNQSKEFLLHRTVVLIIVGVCGSLIDCFNHHFFFFFFSLAISLAVIFGFIILYLRCRHHSLSNPRSGFRRYDLLTQDDDDSPFTSRTNGHKSIRNTHSMPSDSEEDEIFVTSNINKPLLA
jgi:hypothetical protein